MLALVQVDITERGTRAEARTRYPAGDECRRNNRRNVNVSVAYTVAAPEGTRIIAKSISGNISVRDILGVLTLETVSGNVHIASAGCETTGRIVACSDAAVALLGCGASDIVGRRLHDLAQHEDRDRQRAILERLLRGELSFADERLAFVAEPHSSEPVAMRYAVVRDARAHPRAIVVTAHTLPTA